MIEDRPHTSDFRVPGVTTALNDTAAAALNHLLRGATWARDLLQPHAGKTVAFEVAPIRHAFTILESGEVAVAAPGSAPATQIRLTPGLLLRLAARDETAWRDVQLEGDTDLGAAVHQLAHHLRWDVEEDLSRVFGDIAAHRMAETGRAAGRWGRQAADNTGRAFAEYWTEERPLIAGARDLESFYREVDELRDGTDRVEKRVESLLRRRTPG